MRVRVNVKLMLEDGKLASVVAKHLVRMRVILSAMRPEKERISHDDQE